MLVRCAAWPSAAATASSPPSPGAGGRPPPPAAGGERGRSRGLRTRRRRRRWAGAAHAMVKASGGLHGQGLDGEYPREVRRDAPPLLRAPPRPWRQLAPPLRGTLRSALERARPPSSAARLARRGPARRPRRARGRRRGLQLRARVGEGPALGGEGGAGGRAAALARGLDGAERGQGLGLGVQGGRSFRIRCGGARRWPPGRLRSRWERRIRVSCRRGVFRDRLLSWPRCGSPRTAGVIARLEGEDV